MKVSVGQGVSEGMVRAEAGDGDGCSNNTASTLTASFVVRFLGLYVVKGVTRARTSARVDARLSVGQTS